LRFCYNERLRERVYSRVGLFDKARLKGGGRKRVTLDIKRVGIR